jgi:hypothetical protein
MGYQARGSSPARLFPQIVRKAKKHHSLSTREIRLRRMELLNWKTSRFQEAVPQRKVQRGRKPQKMVLQICSLRQNRLLSRKIPIR